MLRVDALTGLRWWAAFMVFAFHLEVFAPLPGVTSAIFGQGFMGVTFFFVLSGFVLTWSASPRVSQSTFYWRRFARIYPSHFVALIFAIPVFYSLTPDTAPVWVKPVSIGILALSVVLIQGWWNNPEVLFSGNPAAWTLTCESFFYLLHPYLSKLLTPLRKRGAMTFGLVVIGIAFTYRALVILVPTVPFGAVPVPLVSLCEFALGMALAWAFRQGWRPRVPVTVGLGAMAAVVAGNVLGPAFFSQNAIVRFMLGFGNELFTVACGLAIVAITGATLAGRSSAFASRIQVRLGEWSFTFYLVHATFIYIALLVFGFQAPSWRNLGWMLLLLAISLLGAAAMHHWLEKPLERRMRAWKDKRVRD